MRIVSFSERDSIEPIFNNSKYQNTHLGWFDLWQLEPNGGCIFFDENHSGSVLISLQPAFQNTVWLHSLLSVNDPAGYDLTGALKKALPHGSSSVYSISSHLWYSRLLAENGFRQCDEIIQMETDQPSVLKRFYDNEQYPIQESDIDLVHEMCESAFPPIWRMRKSEYTAALREADYKVLVRRGSEILGYILASVEPDNCHIMRLAVNPEHQHQGIGAELTCRLIAECIKKGIRNFSVNTNKKNSAAVQLYQSLNFMISGQTYPVFNKLIYSHQ